MLETIFYDQNMRKYLNILQTIEYGKWKWHVFIW